VRIAIEARPRSGLLFVRGLRLLGCTFQEASKGKRVSTVGVGLQKDALPADRCRALPVQWRRPPPERLAIWPCCRYHANMLQRTRPSGFIEPCLPCPADHPPSGPDWIHEIKHDGYRLMARRDPVGIRLLTRNGHDWAPRYPLIMEAVNALKVRSCLIDGEAVACDQNGLAVFELLREKRQGRHIFLYAFDLLELNGKDLKREPFEVRKATLASLLRSCPPGVRFNEHLTHDGEVVFRHACKLGLEGIVSKRRGSIYRSGKCKDWLKFKNPDAPAVKREAEEDWGR
jgi:bifunctional non-homologous end joining protein LigD